MTTHRFVRLLLACSILLTAVTGCKSKDEKNGNPPAPVLVIDERIVFRDGFTEQTIPGRAETTESAAGLHESCEGLLPVEPSAEFLFDGDVPATISVAADIDTVLAIVGPDGVYCNNDTDTMHPAISRRWASGAYKVFVGSAEAVEGYFDYDLNFDHFDPRTIAGAE